MRVLQRIRQRKVLIFATFLVAGSQATADEAATPRVTETSIASTIDQFVEARWEREGVKPAELLDEAALLRRTTLDLAGRIPSLAELSAYGQDDGDRRQRMVDRLLASPDFAFHQRNELDRMLLAERAHDDEWREYLLEAVRRRDSWDRLFRDMMLGPDLEQARQGASGFLKHRAKDLHELTNDTSRLFFGVSINCAQCHDHPLVADWLQDHYFGFQSFFARTYLTKKNVVAEKPYGEVKFKTTSGEEKLAQVMFLTGSIVTEPDVEKTEEQRKAEEAAVRLQLKDADAPPPEKPAFSLREKLVEVALHPEQDHFFARSIVNRTWARLLGRGLVEPLDQMHSENPASHPDLLEWLADDLVAHQYDLVRLIRGIVLSNTYARASVWTNASERPSPELYAVAIPRVLTPRQFALTLQTATTNPDKVAALQRDDWTTNRAAWEASSNRLANELELPSEHFQFSVDEALYLSNSEQFQRDYLSSDQDRLVGYLYQQSDAESVVDLLFRIVLSRSPDSAEREVLLSQLQLNAGERESTIRNLVWALLASPEIRFNY